MRDSLRAALIAMTLAAAACGSNHGGTDAPLACTQGQDQCGGVCVDLAADEQNCGACGTVCAADEQCCASACVVTATCSFAVSSVSPPGGMQNGGDWVTVKGAGFAPGMRVYLGPGRAPTRVIDSATALIQTPPGPVGDTDVQVRLGADTATRRAGFKYLTAGLDKPWKQIPMQTVRGENPALAVLQDGRVTIAGGTTVPDHTENAVTSIETFVRSAEQVLPETAVMATPRWQDSATTLMTGKVLVVGAACHADASNCNGSDPAIAEVFDPATGTIAATTGAMQRPRVYPRMVLLPDGRVLISSANTPDLEVYDPDTDGFTLIPNTQLHRWGVLVRLRDGRALLAGGDGGVTSAQLFDPDTNQLSDTGALIQGRSMLTAHTLPDGRVMIIGGSSVSAGAINTPLATIELYDPATGMFTTAPYTLSIGRTWHASALVRDGTVLVMGGYTQNGLCNSGVGTVDQVDPIAATVAPFDPLPDGHTSTEWNAITLLDGSIVAVGGGACGTLEALPQIYFLPGKPVQ